VLGTHALTSGPYGEAYTCLPRPDVDLGTALSATMLLLPEDVYDGQLTEIDFDLANAGDCVVEFPCERHARWARASMRNSG
jgi:N12 class adenine-specific DNA methylase